MVPLALGGHGLPGAGFIPGEVLPLPLLLPWLPGVGGLELDDPEFGVEPDAPLAVSGKVPHGEPLGEVPGFVEVLGLTVDGCVLVPGVGAFGEFEPGTVVFGVPLGDVDPGVVCGLPVGGVVVPVCAEVLPVGGFTEPVGGADGEAVELCPALLEPPAGAAARGALCATAQLAQHNTTESKLSFRDDISE